MKTRWATLLLFLFAYAGNAQDSSNVRLLVKGVSDQYFISINGTLEKNKSVFRLPQGTHDIQVWSPRYELYTGKIETGTTETTTKLVELKPSTDYMAFIAARESYKKQLLLKRTAPFLVGTVSIVSLPFLYVMRLNKHEELVQSEFYTQFGQITQGTTDNTAAQYRSRNVLFFTAVATAATSTGLFLAFRKQVKNLKPPTFRQQNPFTLEYFDFSLSPQQVPTGSLVFSF
ncbi:MAG: hypothetical protein R2813_12790 [Flavobacteriales bacterium]